MRNPKDYIMKTDYLIILMALLLISIVSPIAAADSFDFDIPYGYHIENASDDFVLLENEDYYSISISIMDNSTDRKTLMDMLERHRCYDFRNGVNYTNGDFYVVEKPYYQEFQVGILYFCENGRDLVVIDYKGPLGMDLNNSPIDGILDSFVFVEENRCIS